MTPDPLVRLWHTRRPLHWRAWAGLTAQEQASLRAALIHFLRAVERGGVDWAWVQTHRELLELKMACGREQETCS